MLKGKLMASITVLSLGLVLSTTGATAKEIKIESGDTLSKLAKEHGITVQDFTRINGIANENLIFAGETLFTDENDKGAVNKVVAETPAETPAVVAEQPVETPVEVIAEPEATEAPVVAQAAPVTGGSAGEATSYIATGNLTATGTVPGVGRTIAVDPSVIPLGSSVYIEVPSMPQYNGTYVAEDTGGAVNGNIIDIFMGSQSEAIQFGRRAINFTVL